METNAPKTKGILSLSARFTLLVAIVIVIAATVFIFQSQLAASEAAESRVLSEARTLASEMQAAWDYVDASQSAINYNADGRYDFKGIYCSIAGKAIAQRFTRESDHYVIRYVRTNPRSGSDEPDTFERAALEAFEGDATEYYAVDSYEGGLSFRYTSKLTLTANCLTCHGDPAGTHDETGYVKEGMHLGDTAGAMSIVVPMESYEQEAHDSAWRSVTFFVVLALAVIGIVSAALRVWVTRPLRDANQRLQDESDGKSEFLATMSHELRTPLSSIIAFTDIWKGSDRERDPEEAKLVEEIKENSLSLLNMVNNTIDVARIEAGSMKLHFDEVDLVDVTSAVFSVAEPLAVRDGISLSNEIDPKIPILISDWEALRKVLMNLVGNALKFTHTGDKIIVRESLERDGCIVLIEVEDTGVGIAVEDQAIIFERFSKAVRAEEPKGGSGLGLFLARSLTERLGGTMEVKSQMGHGSTFTVRLPVDSRVAGKVR